MSLRRRPTVIPIAISEFRFRDPALADRIGVVNSYVVRHAAGVVVVDTGFGTGDPDIDAAYAPRTRPLAEALAEAGVAMDEVTDVVNCHLHVDHAGQNGVLPGVPIHVQSTELAASWTPDYTIPSWIHAPGTSYVETEGDHDVVAGVAIIATPGHTAGHQSVVVESDGGLIVLAGQAVYSVDEWIGDQTDLEGRSSADDPGAYDGSLARLRALDPVAVHVAHDRSVWTR